MEIVVLRPVTEKETDNIFRRSPRLFIEEDVFFTTTVKIKVGRFISGLVLVFTDPHVRLFFILY